MSAIKNYVDGYYLFGIDFNEISETDAGFGVVSAVGGECSVSAPGTDYWISVTSGSVATSKSVYDISPTKITLSALQDATYPKKVIVYIDADDGIAKATAGNAASPIPSANVGRYTKVPVPPDFVSVNGLQPGDVVLSEIWLRPSGNVIQSTDVSDRRYLISNPENTLASVGPNYTIYKDGSYYYARNGVTGATDYSDAVLTTLFQTVTAALGSDGGVVYSALTNETIDFRKIRCTVLESQSVLASAWTNLFTRSGAGCVTSIMNSTEHHVNYNDDYYRFIIDGVTSTADAGTLFGTHFAIYGTAGSLSYRAANVGGNFRYWDKAYGGGYFTVPIYYKTSIGIDFKPNTSNATISCCIWNKNLTESDRVTRISATTYAAGAALNWTSGGTVSFASTSGKAGRLNFVSVVLHDDTGTEFEYLKNNPRITADGVAITSSGLDDFFLGSQYYSNSSYDTTATCYRSVGPYAGVPSKNMTYYATVQFRDFYGERGGVPFLHSMTFDCSKSDAGGQTDYGFFCVWEEF